MNDLKIYTVALYWNYGVECAMAIIETREKALQIIRRQLDMT